MRIVILPSDPLIAYEKKGTFSWLEEYFNPLKYFSEAFILSPLEKGVAFKYGITVRGVRSHWGYRRLLKKLKPDVIRAYGGYWASDFAVFNKVPGVPVAVSVHDTNPKLLHKSVLYADFVICMSEVVQQMVIDFGVEPARTIVLGNRVDLSVFRRIDQSDERIRQIRDRFRKGKMILHVGRQSEQKNQVNLIRALSHLENDYFVVFIGLGNNVPLVEEAEKLRVIDRCQWIPSVPNNELPYWYNACDLVCIPSLWEGFGLVFIEAAACEAPIITSDISPMNEFLVHGENSFLISDSRNAELIAAAIKEVATNSSFKEKITSRVYQVAQRFSKEIIDRKEVDIYQEVIGNRAGLERKLRKSYPADKRKFRSIFKFGD